MGSADLLSLSILNKLQWWTPLMINGTNMSTSGSSKMISEVVWWANASSTTETSTPALGKTTGWTQLFLNRASNSRILHKTQSWSSKTGYTVTLANLKKIRKMATASSTKSMLQIVNSKSIYSGANSSQGRRQGRESCRYSGTKTHFWLLSIYIWFFTKMARLLSKPNLDSKTKLISHQSKSS